MTADAGSCELPSWTSVLAVVAHPDDESFGLGAVLTAFTQRGSRVGVLCLTRGESSTLHGVKGDLAVLRAAELQAAADALGADQVLLRDYPDGALAGIDQDVLVDEVLAAGGGAEGLLAFDASGVTGHQDHAAATAAALTAGRRLGVPVLGWTLPAQVVRALNEEFGASFTGHEESEVDLVLPVDRERQLRAVACHPSQAVPGSVLWRRLELLGDREHLRWLDRT